MTISISLHILAAAIWVGGMFFAYMALRPAAATLLEPPQRLQLWVGVFRRFFIWVWLSIILLLATGYWMVFGVFDGFGSVGTHIHIMHGGGWFMITLFLYVFLSPYRHLRHNVIAGDFPAAAACLQKIRGIIAINLSLGLAIVAIASGGRYF